jgi:hypothetical protein
MKVLSEQKNHLKEAVRKILVADPLITIRHMQNLVEIDTGRSIGSKYLVQLMDEIRQEAGANADPDKVKARIQAMRARYEPIATNLLTIAWTGHKVTHKDRIACIKATAYLDTMLLRAEMYAEAFDRRGTVIELKEKATFSRSVRIEQGQK